MWNRTLCGTACKAFVASVQNVIIVLKVVLLVKLTNYIKIICVVAS